MTILTQPSQGAVTSMATEWFIGLVIGILIITSPLFLVRREDDEENSDDPKSEPEFVTHDLSPEVNERMASKTVPSFFIYVNTLTNLTGMILYGLRLFFHSLYTRSISCLSLLSTTEVFPPSTSTTSSSG